ncbi:HlyD family secretion protein [Devosia aurantiaca]|nr:HlyD family secretion protein [Devosia aurantiaca]
MNTRVENPDPQTSQRVSLPVEGATDIAAATIPAKKKRNPLRFLLMAGVPVLLLGGGAYFYLTGGRYIDTDNAYVQQSKVSISSDVAGRIVSVAVANNQSVHAGDALFTVDPEPYRIALSQADAALASARVNVEQLRVGLAVAQAKLDAARSTLDIRQKDWDRKQALRDQGVTAESSLDDARLALQTAQSTVALEEQDVASATAALGGNPEIETDQHPAVLAAIAARDNAARNLDKTTILAPADGIISQVASLNVGQFVAMGSTIATLVETERTWVEANFKETQLTGLATGMPVEISVDAYPGLALAGHVDSIGAATGAEFALIPAQNATGNWVKVVQRIPVRIVLDGGDSDKLRAGMSAAVKVDTQPEGAAS